MFSLSNAEELRQKAIQTQQAQEAKQGSSSSDPDQSNTKYSPDKQHDAKVSATGESEKMSKTPPAAGADGVEEETSPAMSPEQIEEFFLATIERLTSQEEREAIKAKVTKETRIPAILIQIQHDQLGKMGVGQEEGQAALNHYSKIIAMADEEARRKMESFTHTCQRTYIEVLRDIQPEEEENEAKLTPDQIMEFFEACDTLLALPETRENLRKEFLETEVPPDETIVGMQRSMLRTLGFNPEHGVACLNDFPEDYPDDVKLQMRLRQFIQCAAMARQEAMLGKEEMTKRMQVHQAMAMKERKMATELNVLDDAGKKELRRRVSEMQRKHAMAVVTLKTKEERMAYVKGIPPEEQWEIAKLKMLTMQEQAARAGGQCPHQGQGAPFMRHGFGPMGGPHQGAQGEQSQGQKDGASKK